MTDEQIVRALECCGKMKECKKECPLGDVGGIDKCMHTLMLDAFDFIKRQQAEIERLKTNLEDIETEYEAYKEGADVAWAKARAEAVREFAERLQTKIDIDLCAAVDCAEYVSDDLPMIIKNLVKEMTEKEGGKG